MDAVKKVLRKIKHIPVPLAIIPPDPFMDLKVEAHKREFWERDKKNKRDENFKKAQAARALQVEAINTEKERQAEIALQRLKNLKKARRKLAKKRENQ